MKNERRDCAFNWPDSRKQKSTQMKVQKPKARQPRLYKNMAIFPFFRAKTRFYNNLRVFFLRERGSRMVIFHSYFWNTKLLTNTLVLFWPSFQITLQKNYSFILINIQKKLAKEKRMCLWRNPHTIFLFIRRKDHSGQLFAIIYKIKSYNSRNHLGTQIKAKFF